MGQRLVVGDSIIPLKPLWSEYKRLIKCNGAAVLFGSQPFTSKLVMSNLEWFKYEWIWDKLRGKGHLVAKYRPMQRTESLLVFGKQAITYHPQMNKRDKPYYNHAPSSAWDGMKQKIDDSYKGKWVGETYPTNVIELSWSPVASLHSTQKPTALLAYLIRTYTNPGELILDNTMGSGTTLVAAQNEGRQAVGIEISEEYCRIAVDRLKQPSFFSLPLQSTNEAAQQMRLQG